MDSANPELSPDTKLDHFRQTRVTPEISKVHGLLRNGCQDTFNQIARPLARVGFGSSGAPQKALLLLFLMMPTPSTSFNSFPSYPILNPASWMENPKHCPGGTFIQGAQPLPCPCWIWLNLCFSGSISSPLSNGANTIHLLQLVPELFHFPSAPPMDHHWLTRLYGPNGIFYVYFSINFSQPIRFADRGRLPDDSLRWRILSGPIRSLGSSRVNDVTSTWLNQIQEPQSPATLISYQLSVFLHTERLVPDSGTFETLTHK